MNKFRRMTVRVSSAFVAVVSGITFLPLAPVTAALAESDTVYSPESGMFAFHSESDILLNESEVTVNGSIYAADKLDFTGEQENLSVSGELLSGEDNAVCEVPDYTDIIDCDAEYDFKYDGDKEISDSVINLSESSLYTTGSMKINHAELTGEGNITASEDIDMELCSSENLQQAVIMSEKGDISLNAANLSFSGVLYAPEGKVTVNAKQLNFTGVIYAEEIELNGTYLNVQYKDYIPDALVCRAGEEDIVHVQQGKEITLAGFCNYDDAEVRYTVAPEQEQNVELKKDDTLSPTFIFKEPGEYEVTLTALRDGETAVDTIKIYVTFGAVVHYTSSEDFESGELLGLNEQKDELKLLSESKAEESLSGSYNLNDESGISVKSSQNKSVLASSGDSLELSYELNGYGKTESGNGSDVILVIDNSGSVSGMVPTIKETSLQILDFMGPNDRFGIASLDQTNTVLTDSKKALTEAVGKYSLTGGSDYGNGLKVAMDMFDEKSTDRNKYIILLADGENSSSDDIVAEDTAKLAAENGVKIYSFEINPFSNNFSDTRTMQQIAIETGGAYKLCPSAEAISAFMLNMADSIYNLAARNVTFTTTIVNSGWMNSFSAGKAPDSIVYNEDGSATVSWNYNSFEIGETDRLMLDLKTDMPGNSGYELITTDTKLIYYGDSGEGSIIYLDDVITGKNDFTESGTWSSRVFDSKKDSCTWSLVNWNAGYCGDSEINVYLSTSSDGINFSSPVQVSNGQQLNLRGRYIRTFIRMNASEDGETPVLYDLSVYSDDDIKAVKPDEGNSIEICGAKTVCAGCPLTLWLDISGNYDNISDIEWSITDNSKAVCDELSKLKRKVTFTEEGEYSITASVTAGGIKSEASVNITVLPEKKLSQSEGGAEYKPVDMTVSDTPDYVTSYTDPLSFSISFKNPEQVSWMRVLYSNQKAWGETVYQAYIDESDDNTVKITLPSTSPSDTVITVQAFDWYGNMCEEIRNVRMDRTAPNVTLSADKYSMYPGAQAVISASSTDNDEISSAVLRCREDELTLDENGQYIFQPQQSGEYVFTYIAIDKAGLETSRSITINVREDNVQPNISLSGTNRVILGNSAELKITASDAQTGLAYWKLNLDDGSELLYFDHAAGEVPSEYTYTFTPSADGKYVFTAEACDNSGNIKTVSYTVDCVPDTNGPDITINLSRNEVLTGEQVVVSVSASDDVSVSELHFFADGTEQQLSEDSTFIYTADDSGFDGNTSKLVVFSASAKDSSGNEKTASKELKVNTVDKTAPVIKISIPKNFEYNSENAYMEVTVTDNISVDNISVFIDDNAAELDENGRYYFDTSELYEYSILVKAADTSGNEASEQASVQVVDSREPDISIVKDKSGYIMGDSAVFTVTVQDNLAVHTVEASCNGEIIETDNGSFEYRIENLKAGIYELYVKATDSSGNVTEKTVSITVKDTEAPVAALSSDKEKYAAGEKPVIECILTDNVEVTKVEADLSGAVIEYDFVNGRLIMPEEYSPGEYVLSVTAYDGAGNASETASITFEISDSSDTVNPVIGDVTYVPEVLYTGNECKIKAEASDDSGNVSVTLTVGDEVLEYDAFSNSWLYIPDTVGEVRLLVHAEDEAGNYAEKEVFLKVYANPEGHKLKVDAPALVSLTDTITVTLSSTDGNPFDEAELWMADQEIPLTQNSDGTFTVSFTLNQTGIASFKAVGRDSNGYEDTAEFTVQVSSDYNTEIQSEAMQALLVQTSETALNDELKALAGIFESPAEAYEYVYNNIAFECYVNSRRGATGAYELKSGNDYDQASLLIGLLREMGYPARYAQGSAVLTEEQAMSLMAMEDFNSASGMLASSGKKAGLLTDENGQQFVKMEEIYVQVYVPGSELGETDEDKKKLGVWVKLDTSIKDSELKEVALAADETSLSEEISALCAEYNGTEIEDFAQQMDGVYNKKTSAYIRDIVQVEINSLPSSLQYSLYPDDGESTFDAIPMSMSDTVQFAVSNGFSGKNLGTYKISELYGKRVTIQYVGNTSSGTIFDMNKTAIYSNAFLPALTIDGEIAAEYTYSELTSALRNYFIEPEDEYYFLKNQSWRLGEKNTLVTRITSGGKSEDITDELIIGNTYALSFDTGGITGSQINNAVNNAAVSNGIDISDPDNPVFDKESPAYPTAETYYDEDKIGSFLDFAGKYYFLMCDAYGTINANLSNVESSQYTKMVITSYNAGFYEDTIQGFATTDVIPGRFEIDVAYNTGCSFSRTGDTEERNICMLSTAYMESYYEGWIWESLLFQSGVSTVSIINDALELGADLLFIDSSNIDTMLEKADVTSDEESEIRKEAANGRVIIIPDKRIRLDAWSGTGYIIADFEDYNNFVFKVSGGINGGSGTTTVDLADLKALTSTAMEKTFETSFVICQSMYYYLLETTMCQKVMPAAEACANACQSGSNAAIALTGMKLYNEVNGLAGVINFRVRLLDTLSEYCSGDQFKATTEILTLLVDMVKKLTHLTGNDARKAFFKALGLPEEITDVIITADSFERNFLKMLDKLFDTNFYQEDWFDKATKTPSFA